MVVLVGGWLLTKYGPHCLFVEGGGRVLAGGGGYRVGGTVEGE